MGIPAPRPSRLAMATGTAFLIAALLGGCALSPFSPGPSLAEAKAAYYRQDYGTAARLLASLAYEGEPEAQYALGYMYYYGRGVRQNRKWAISWFGEAARLGHPKAGQALASLRSEARLTRRPEVAGTTRTATAPSRTGSTLHSQAAPTAGTRVSDQQGFARKSQRQQRIARQQPGPRLVTGEAPRPRAGEPRRQNAALPGGPADHSVAGKPAVTAASGQAVSKTPAMLTARSNVSTGAAAEPDAATKPVRTGMGQQPIAETAQPEAPSGAIGAKRDEPATPRRSERPAQSEGKDRGEGQRLSAGRPRFTLQLIGSRSKQDLVELVERFDLNDVRYFQGEYKGGPWYRLLYLGFDSLAEARQALKRLPPEMRRHKPWVRNFPPVRVATLRRFD